MPIPLVGCEFHLRRTFFQEAVHLQHLAAEVEEDFVAGAPRTAGRHETEFGLLLRHVNQITAIGTVLGRRTEFVELTGRTRCAESEFGTIHHVLLLVSLEVGTEHLVVETGTHQVVETAVFGTHSGTERIHFTDIEDDTVRTATHALDQLGARHVGRNNQGLLADRLRTEFHIRLAFFLQGPLAFLFPQNLILFILMLLPGILLIQQLLDRISQTGSMGHHPFPTGRGSDDSQKQMRIDIGIVIDHLHLRHASAQVGEHTQKEHVTLPLVLRHFHPIGQERRQGFENPVGQTRGCQAHLPVAGTGFFLPILHVLPSCEGCT